MHWGVQKFISTLSYVKSFKLKTHLYVIHSNLPYITHVATKVHVMLRRYVVLT